MNGMSMGGMGGGGMGEMPAETLDPVDAALKAAMDLIDHHRVNHLRSKAAPAAPEPAEMAGEVPGEDEEALRAFYETEGAESEDTPEDEEHATDSEEERRKKKMKK